MSDNEQRAKAEMYDDLVRLVKEYGRVLVTWSDEHERLVGYLLKPDERVMRDVPQAP